MPDSDVLVIGSGPAGVHAADVLLKAGKSVVMIDGGKTAPDMSGSPTDNFAEVRKYEGHQADWFLGKDLSGIPVSGLTGGLGGGQVSGNRGYVVEDAAKELPIAEDNCQIIQSLAEGGLGAAWGAACSIPKEGELHAMGLDPKNLEPHLRAAIEEVGVSGPDTRAGMQPALPPDLHASLALDAYRRKKKAFDAKHLSVAQPLSAILTQDKNGRKASSLADMEYWSDPGKSVWRPQYLLETLRTNQAFRMESGCIAESVASDADGVTVTARGLRGGTKALRAKHVILAAGALGSARIALRSLGLYETPLPAAKPHVFTACLHAATLGKAGPDKRTSLCQLLVTDDADRSGMRAGVAQLYSYRSLLLFRLLTSQPLPAPEAMRVLSLLTPALVIADIRFPADPSLGSVALGRDHVLKIGCRVSSTEKALRDASWKRLRTGLRMLGMLPVRNMVLPEGSASHYGGTLPHEETGGPLTTDARGHLRGLPNVWVADGSVFRTLPAVPHTLVLMANARRIAASVAGA
jgi:choline dehydrogenase-like flavoprotein